MTTQTNTETDKKDNFFSGFFKSHKTKKNEKNTTPIFERYLQWLCAEKNNTSLSGEIVGDKQLGQNNEKNTLQQEISVYFDEYLNISAYFLCIDLINSGYKPTKRQQKLFDKGIYLENKDNSNFLYEYYQKNKAITPLLIDWLKHHEPDYFSYKRYLKDILKQSDVCIDIFNEINKNIDTHLKNFTSLKNSASLDGYEYNRNKINDFYNLILNNHHINIYSEKEGVSRLADSNCSKINKESLQLYKKNLEKIIFKINACVLWNALFYGNEKRNARILKIDEFKQLIKDVDKRISEKLVVSHQDLLKKLEGANTISNLESKITHNIKARTIDIKTELPTEAKALLEEINGKYIKIKEYSKNSINMSLIEIDTLYEVNTVKIIQQYLSIDDEFKTNLKDKDGRDAKTIMLDSLTRINATLDKELLEINTSKINNLSISNTVIKNKTMSH